MAKSGWQRYRYSAGLTVLIRDSYFKEYGVKRLRTKSTDYPVQLVKAVIINQ